MICAVHGAVAGSKRCRPCWATYMREYYARKSTYRQHTISRMVEYNRLPSVQERRKARRRVSHAIRAGKLQKPKECPFCGSVQRRIEAHHEDYARPLSVVWACSSCHAAYARGEIQ